MSVLYEILVATAFSLLLSPTSEVDNTGPEKENLQEVSASVETGENASEAADCIMVNPEP